MLCFWATIILVQWDFFPEWRKSENKTQNNKCMFLILLQSQNNDWKIGLRLKKNEIENYVSFRPDNFETTLFS